MVSPLCKQGQSSVITHRSPRLLLPIWPEILLRMVGMLILPLHTNLLSAHTFVEQNAHTLSLTHTHAHIGHEPIDE